MVQKTLFDTNATHVQLAGQLTHIIISTAQPCYHRVTLGLLSTLHVLILVNLLEIAKISTHLQVTNTECTCDITYVRKLKVVYTKINTH